MFPGLSNAIMQTLRQLALIKSWLSGLACLEHTVPYVKCPPCDYLHNNNWSGHLFEKNVHLVTNYTIIEVGIYLKKYV